MQQIRRAWVPGTHIKMVSVPWDAQYRDVVEWGSIKDRDQYFDGLEFDEWTKPADKDYTYLRPGEPISLPLPYNVVMRHNYIVVTNPPEEGDIDRRLYYFITGVSYDAPETTTVTLQLDVWTTYGPTTKWGQCFVERGHLGLANENATDDPSSLLEYQTVPEDIDVGDVLVPAKEMAWNIYHEKPESGTHGHDGSAIMVVSNVDLQSDPGDTTNGLNQKTAVGGIVDGVPAGSTYLAMDQANWLKFIAAIHSYSWISKNIISMYSFPGYYVAGDEETWPINAKYGNVAAYVPRQYERGIFKYIRLIESIKAGIPEQYRIVRKLLTYPYSTIIMHNLTGTILQLKPQLLTDRDTSPLYRGSEIDYISNSIMPFARIGYYVNGYAKGSAENVPVNWHKLDGNVDTVWQLPAGDYTRSAVWFDNWPQFSVVNDGYQAYLASTAHSRQYSYDAAGWSRTKGQAALDMQRDVTEQSLSTAQANQDLANQQTDINRFIGLAGQGVGMIPTVASGNVGGAAMQGLSAISGLATSGLSQFTNNAQFGNNQNQAQYALDANQKYGEMANRGDYQMQVQAILAAQQDAASTPPSTSGQMGGEGFNYATGQMALVVEVRTMTPGLMHMVGDFYLRYGIAIRRFLQMPERLCCMSKFAYWKLSEAYIIDSEGDESSRATLRGILQKGVTIWDRPDYIGSISLYDNQPRKGYSY